jgi:hypothetical protein
VRNIYRKVKKIVHKTLSPASVDKSVHKIALRSKFRTFSLFKRPLPKK